MVNLFFAFTITLVSALIWLRLVDFLAFKGVISSQLSRKIIHIGTGPIFVICWLLFPDVTISRYLAAVVPLLISIQFFLIGIGVIKDKASVDAMSRSGDPKEILKGPLIYGIMFVILTIIFWKDHPAGILGLMVLCGGDGLADIVGRRMSSKRLPWAKAKTVAGTTAMFLGSFLMSYLLLYIFIQAGVFLLDLSYLSIRILLISIIAALVESIPVKDLDNLTVPVAVVLIGVFLF